MAIQTINLGAPVTGEGGDDYRQAHTKINENFTEIGTDITGIKTKNNTQDTAIVAAKSVADAAIPKTDKGAASGVATLGTDGKVTPAQLPATNTTVTNVLGPSTTTATSQKLLTDYINTLVARTHSAESKINTLEFINFTGKLFSNTSGTLLEPYNIENLYQDVAGITSVTAAGDPIGLVKDKSGNNINAVQTVSTKRPTHDSVDGRGVVNLFIWSGEIVTTRTWSVLSSTSIAVSNILAPTGDTAYLLKLDNGISPSINNGSGVYRILSVPSGAATYSFYVKDAGSGSVRVREGAELGTFLDLNLLTGVITNNDDTQFISPKATALADGWYRLSFTTKSNITNTSKYVIRPNSTGDNINGILISSIQFELSALTEYQHNNSHTGGTGSGKSTDVYYLTLDKVDDELVIVVPTGGWIGTMVLATVNGTASYEMNIPAGNFVIGGQYYPTNGIVGVLLLNKSLSASDKEKAEAYFVSKGATASYSSETDFSFFWYSQNKITKFPLINTSNALNFYRTWYGCTSLTSFPLLNTSNVTNLESTWRKCTALTSFPLLNTSKVTNFRVCWYDCTSLTSFPLLDTSSGTSFDLAWYGCTSLTSFPANMFNSIKGGNFGSAFLNTNLSQSSIDGILTSLVTSGIAAGTRIFDQTGGSAPSATGRAAIDTLRSRGWTVTTTGGY